MAVGPQQRGALLTRLDHRIHEHSNGAVSRRVYLALDGYDEVMAELPGSPDVRQPVPRHLCVARTRHGAMRT
jgi:hypothetical protein